MFGAVVATATLADCVRVWDLPAALRTHAHAHGPWCWILTDVVRLDRPVSMAGMMGLWTVDEAALQ